MNTIRKTFLFAVMIGALALSFGGQVIAVTPVKGHAMAVVFAATVDLATLLALNEVTTARSTAVRRWAWAVLLLAGSTTLTLNTWEALQGGRVPSPFAVLIGAGPAVLAWIVSHLTALVVSAAAEDRAVPAGGSAPSNPVPVQLPERVPVPGTAPAAVEVPPPGAAPVPATSTAPTSTSSTAPSTAGTAPTGTDLTSGNASTAPATGTGTAPTGTPCSAPGTGRSGTGTAPEYRPGTAPTSGAGTAAASTAPTAVEVPPTGTGGTADVPPPSAAGAAEVPPAGTAPAGSVTPIDVHRHRATPVAPVSGKDKARAVVDHYRATGQLDDLTGTELARQADVSPGLGRRYLRDLLAEHHTDRTGTDA